MPNQPVEQGKYLMKRPFRYTILALVFCLILIASFNILNRPSRDEKTFKMQAVEWIPIGTTVEAAKKIMTKKQFEVSRHVVAATKNEYVHEELRCYRTAWAGPGMRRSWFITLEIDDNERVIISGCLTHVRFGGT
jgi:hypothetical protein